MNEFKKTTLKLLCLLMMVSLFSSCRYKKGTWVVYYGKHAPPELLSEYGIVVIDPVYPHTSDLLNKPNTNVFIYVSIGEVRKDQDDLFRESKAAGLLLQENENWKGSYIVDIRNNKWMELLQEHVLNPLSIKGYSGFMLDTGDSPLSLENIYPGMKDALINLCRTLRQEYPDHEIIINRSFEAFPDIGPYIDYVIFESMLTHYNFYTQQYEMREKSEIQWLKGQQDIVKRSNSRITILALDYWPKEEPEQRKKISEQLRKLGFIPYISTIMLDDV